MAKRHFYLYLDESGDNQLYAPEEYDENADLETHCTLVGVVLSHPQKESLGVQLSALKKEFWRTEDVVLHSVKIRNKEGPFAIFHYDPNLYEEFKRRICELVESVNPVIICSSLNKRLWVEKYPRKLVFRDDPYEEAFVYLLERYSHFLNKQRGEDIEVVGRIIAESRDSKRDKELLRKYTSIRTDGTQYFRTPDFGCLPVKMDIEKKSYNIAGLQMSDYCCYPFYVNHKSPKQDNKLYDFLEKFIYPGEFARYGHKKWPV